MGLEYDDMGGFSDLAMGQRNSQQGDENLYVRFDIRPWKNAKKSTEEGRPIFEDREFVTIMQPGNKESIIVHPVTDIDRQRFARVYTAFKSNENLSLDGTPLEEWTAISRSQVEELKYFNVRTVEQLAGMSDANAQGFMGSHDLRKRAQAFIETAKGSAGSEKLVAELDKVHSDNTALLQAVEEMKARIVELETTPTKGRK